MKKVAKSLAISLVAAAAVWAQGQIATVTSSAPFNLRGAAVTPGQGVPSWPVMATDKVKSGTAVAIITYSDGSVITLDPNSEGVVDMTGQTPVFRLTKGQAHYSLKSLTAVQLMEASQSVVPKKMEGLLALGRRRKGGGAAVAGAAGAAAGWSATTVTLVTVGAVGAATGIGFGVAQATSGGSSVSPSK
jgi:ferric-dicitrate binding protein FerR (iron transport regulator)